MARRFLKKLPRRTLQVVGVLLVVGVLAFFALTRTEVGRQQLKQEIEAQFDARFAGQLQIGRLTGNLVGTVYARDVRLQSSEGETILSVDSVRAVPRWRSLFRREVFFRKVELVEPALRLVRSDSRDGSTAWNLARAFRRTMPHDTTSGSAPFALGFPDVVVRGGQLQTKNRGAQPRLVQQHWLFDYTDTRLADLHARLSFERRPGGTVQLDLHRLSGQIAGPDVPITEAQGQIALASGGLALRRLRLQLGQTRLRGTFSVNSLAARTPSGDAPTLQVDLQESRLDHNEIRRLVPRWPLRGETTAALEARGPLGRLAVHQLRVEHGQSVLHAEGSVQGLPDDLVFDLQFEESRLTAPDLRAVLPGLPRQKLAQLARFGTARFSLGAEGRLANLSGERRLTASTRFDVQTDAGALRGTADVSRRPGQPLAYDADVRAENFEASRLTDASALPSRLTGTLTLSGEGLSTDALAGQLEARLERSVVAGRRLDGLDADVRLAGDERLAGTVALRQRGGTLRLDGTADLSGAQPDYEITARGERFDLGALLGRDSLSTALTGTAQFDGRGASLGALAGRLHVALDSSTVARGGGNNIVERALPPLTSTLRLAAPGEEGPRIALRGDLADLTVTGEADLAALRALGRLWGRAFADAFRTAYRKPYRADAGPASARATAPPPEDRQSDAKQSARRALRAAGLGDTLALQADVTLKRPGLLRAVFPALPELRDSLALQAGLRASAGTFSARGTLRADRLRAGPLKTNGVESQFQAQAALTDAPLLETLDATFDASADTLGLGRTRFQAPALALSYHERTGDLQLSTSAAGGSGRLQLGAALRLLPDRNRLLVRTLRLAAGDYRWQNAAPHPIDLYADAVVVPGLTLVSQSGAGRRTQRVQLRGALSAAPQDTLFANAQGVRLRPASRVAGLQHPVGGRLDAELAWTGGTHAPQLTGQIDVARLAFDNRLLGRLTAQSRYVPGTPDVAFAARLQPAEEADGSARALPGAANLRPEENRLSARGTVALPGLGAEASNAGALDLALDLERADLFFFDYLFDEQITGAGGGVTGTGRIRGTFRDPLFLADLQVKNGQFRVPRFGLRYAAEGNVTVDHEGIKIRRGRVTDPDGGSARVEGALLFNDYEYFSFDLSAALDELRIMDVEDTPDLPFYGEIAASGPAHLRGPLSSARLTSDRIRTTPESELVLPVEEEDAGASESGFLIFADSTGQLPDLEKVTRREGILDDRPAGERSFADGLELDLGIAAPEGSTVRLVFDPLLGDEIAAVGSGQIQLLRTEGNLSLFGTFDVNSGNYLFTAGQVFQRRFQIESGTMRWDGPPANAQLNLTATYRTRVSPAGLPSAGGTNGGDASGRIPIVVRLGIEGRVQQPAVDLALAVDRAERGFSDYSTTGLETILNREDRESEYATSVLLTNTFLLTTDLAGNEQQSLSETGNRLAFNSVSQLVSSQLNRYLAEALPGLDVNLGVQGEDPQDLDVIYGVALRLLDERLVIRGEGVLNDAQANEEPRGFEGEFVVEVRLTPRVSVEAFFRREGNLLSERALTSTTGAGLSYQTEFPTWKRLWHRLFGWLGAGEDSKEPASEDDTVAAGN